MNNPPREKEYRAGNAEAEALIDELSGISSSAETRHLMHEILTTAVKLGLESGDRGDLKLVNSALKELRHSFKIFVPYRGVKKVILFGSARSPKTSAEYKMAEAFASRMTRKGYMVVTGGGPGVMEAGNKGSIPGKDFALSIRLPHEQKTNPFVSEKEKIINFKYFFTRKLVFIKETDATTLFPGGFGTNDEGFEALTLIQTGKSKPRPVLLMEPEGSTYWKAWERFVKSQLVKGGYINREDMHLYKVVKSVDEAEAFIDRFYSVYHSIRYLPDGETVIRLVRPIGETTLRRINKDFKDILTQGDIRRSGLLKEEQQKGEYLELPRLVMRFDRRRFGRLMQLIHVINGDQELAVRGKGGKE